MSAGSKTRNVPHVLLDRKIEGTPANFVGIDDVMAGSLATNHLLDVGCKVVAHLGGSEVSTALDRQTGYSMALAQKGIVLSSDYILRYGSVDDSGDASGYDGMKRLLTLNPRPDGMFCCNDPIAMGAMRAILEQGPRIPEDIAIIGCGNLHYDNLLRVPLSSIDQDNDGLGDSAAKLAMSIVKKRKKAVPPKTVLLDAKLIVRASSARLEEA